MKRSEVYLLAFSFIFYIRNINNKNVIFAIIIFLRYYCERQTVTQCTIVVLKCTFMAV